MNNISNHSEPTSFPESIKNQGDKIVGPIRRKDVLRVRAELTAAIKARENQTNSVALNNFRQIEGDKPQVETKFTAVQEKAGKTAPIPERKNKREEGHITRADARHIKGISDVTKKIATLEARIENRVANPKVEAPKSKTEPKFTTLPENERKTATIKADIASKSIQNQTPTTIAKVGQAFTERGFPAKAATQAKIPEEKKEVAAERKTSFTSIQTKSDDTLPKEGSEVFQKFETLLKELQEGRTTKKLIQKDGDISVVERSKRRIGSFLTSGKSDRTQNALESILVHINESLRADKTGYTDVNGNKQSFEKLAAEFLKTSYAQNVVKNSPTAAKYTQEFAKLVALPQLKEITANLKLNLGVESDISNDLNKTFSALLDANPYDVKAMLNFINDLPKIVNSSKNIQEKESLSIKDLDIKIQNPKMMDKIDRTLNEIVNTENTFIFGVTELLNYYEDLGRNNLITPEKHKEVTSNLKNIINQSASLIKELQNTIVDPRHKYSIDQKLEVFHKAFSPNNIKNYLDSLYFMVTRYSSLRIELEEIHKTDKGKELFNAFNSAHKADRLNIFDHLIMPVQRLMRHPILLEAVNHDLHSAAIDSNRDYIVAYARLINSRQP